MGAWAALALASLLLLPAAAAASTWQVAQLPGAAAKVFLLGISCPSRDLCVATGTNNLIASSTDPTGGAGSWRYGYAGDGPWEKTDEWPTEFISGKQVQSVSCPSASLCVAVTDQGFIYSTTDPTAPPASWNSIEVDNPKGRNTHLFAVSCATEQFCVAVSGKREDEGKVLTSTNPTGGLAAWQQYELGESVEFRGISCPTPASCVAVTNDGRVLVASNPAAGPGGWSALGTPAGPGSLRSVSCTAVALCVSGNQSGRVLASTNPAAAASWEAFDGGGSVQITGSSCTARGQCLLVDNNGDVLASSDPTAGSGAWSFDNLLPFTAAEGNALFAASCPSGSFCAAAGTRGQILTSTDPFAAERPAPAAAHRRRRGRKRPRVWIARLQLPFRNALVHHRARIVVRFYARGGVRGYSCKLDRHRWRRCRSPKRYPIAVGRHVFRVRATGLSGLRGPVTSERFEIPPLCPQRGARPRHCF